VQEDRLPSGREFFAEIYRLWKEDGVMVGLTSNMSIVFFPDLIKF